MNPMIPNPASIITKAASKQTYYTIRFLVDRARLEDAYRAYAYFRWVDDVLDAGSGSGSVLSAVEAPMLSQSPECGCVGCSGEAGELHPIHLSSPA